MEYRILRLGHRGDGIAEGPVYAPRTLPGEVVSGIPDGERLTGIRILTPSADRVSPSCRHFRSCGGCQVMHARDDVVSAWKTDIVAQALAAQGLEAPILPIQTSPARSRRRAGFAGRRTKSGALVGFHGRASDTIVEIPGCQLITDDLRAALVAAGEIVEQGGSRKSVLTVQITETLEGLDVFVTNGKSLTPDLRRSLAALTERHRFARLSWDGEVIAMRVAPIVAMGPARVTPPPGSFLQATRHGQDAIVSAVKQAIDGAHRVVDLFAGCGTLSLPLAEDATVHAVEGDAAMLAALDQGWRQSSGLKHVTTEARDLFRNPLLVDELQGFDAAVIDPPRAGAEAQSRALASAGMARIGFVSCNPQTFARDARILTDAGYCLDWVQPVDQFRWSSHVELAAGFSLSHM